MPAKLLPRERAWGTRYDTLGSSPPSSPTRRAPTEHMHTTISSPRGQHAQAASTTAAVSVTAPLRSDAQDGTPHDASIFVGSLPANFDHGDLTRRLTEHLSSYSQVKAIKVVRDSRGGVCAFVQCETPAVAGHFLQELQVNPPPPFLGRCLRFEPAKAFRTLLVSYRVPTGLPPNNDGLSGAPDGSPVKLRLAHAMRIFRPRHAKYLSLLYDADAMNFDVGVAVGNPDEVEQDQFGGEGLLFNPLKYDAETLKLLATAFGPLETLQEYNIDSAGAGEGTTRSSHPYPHNTPRSSEMANGVWEVKWKDRGDSVAALLTLRRVPHLSVSWAHHPQPTNTPIPSTYKPNLLLPSSPWIPSPRRHIQLDGRGPADGSPVKFAQENSLRVKTPPTSTASPSVTLGGGGVAAAGPQWSTAESPTHFAQIPGSSTRWADQLNELDSLAVSPGSTSTSSPPFTPLLDSGSNALVGKPEGRSFIHRVPAYDSLPSPYTPRVNRYLPRTPPNFGAHRGELEQAASGSREREPGSAQGEVLSRYLTPGPSHDRDSSRELDPTTVFVGGLDLTETNTWDEDRLRRIFVKFGNIENIHIVKPINKRSGFAFVKFADRNSASHAVHAEHNRIYDGRPIRVQFRDRNPGSRGAWRMGRGRGGRTMFGGHPAHEGGLPSSAGDVPGVPIAAFEASGNVPSTFRPEDTIVPSSQSQEDLARREHVLRTHIWQEDVSTSMSTSSLSSGTTRVPSRRGANSQGPPSTGASLTPPPQSASVAASVSPTVPVAPYQMNMGFFPPQPWAQPYPSSYPYPFPVMPGYGYVGYPYHQIPSISPAVFSGDGMSGSSVPGSSISPWASASTDRSSKDHGGTETSPAAGHTSDVNQPPLRATGFIQNEHGGLIPVYQREALDEYMANAHGRQPLPIHARIATSSETSALGPSASTWHQPAPFAIYPGTYHVGLAPVSAHPPSLPPQQQFWMPGNAPYGVPAYHPPNQPGLSAPLMPNFASSTAAPGGAAMYPPSIQLPPPGVAQHGGSNVPPFLRRHHSSTDVAVANRPLSARGERHGGSADFRGNVRNPGPGR